MTDSDVKTENWAPFHDAKHYQADALSGQVRSLPHHDARGQFHPGTDPLKCHPDGDGYMRFNYRDDNGVRQEGASRARCMLMAHNPEGYFPGAEACHNNFNRQDDRLVNLRWDTSEANRMEALEVRMTNNPPKPKPLKECARCGAEHDRKGQNCLTCMMNMGVKGARHIAGGMPLDKAAKELRYPAAGVFGLAVKYGGLRVWIDQAAVTGGEPATSHAESPMTWSRSVLMRARAWRRNSDGA